MLEGLYQHADMRLMNPIIREGCECPVCQTAMLILADLAGEVFVCGGMTYPIVEPTHEVEPDT